MVSNRLGLVLDDDAALPDLEAAAARLRALLPGIDADRFAEAFPAVLDVDDFERALEARRRRRKGGCWGVCRNTFGRGPGLQRPVCGARCWPALVSNGRLPTPPLLTDNTHNAHQPTNQTTTTTGRAPPHAQPRRRRDAARQPRHGALAHEGQAPDHVRPDRKPVHLGSYIIE